ncbi:MAG: protease inhibitor I42 family protein [Candidatus Omnitrophica bacterium]|nr:protease inhibitor I42 family protein [Candidatus Omnitrophota bacterium]
MKSRIFVFGFMLCCLSLFACKDSSAVKIVDGKKLMEVKAGEEFSISVYANPSTGYEWQLAEALDGNFLVLVNKEYSGGDPTMVGSGCEQEWTFKALKPGSTKISLKYLRSWEKGVPPVKIEEFEINIR